MLGLRPWLLENSMAKWLTPSASGKIYRNSAGRVYTGTAGVPVFFEDADVAGALVDGWSYSATAPLEPEGKLIPLVATLATDPLTGRVVAISDGAGGTFPLNAISPGNTIALLGDSRVANNSSSQGTLQQGYFTNLNALLGDRFNVLGSFAVGGTTLDQVLSTQIPQLAALSPRPAYVFMESGHNDLYPAVGNKSAAATIASWELVYAAINALGITLIQSTTLPSTGLGTTTLLANLAIYNKYLMAQNGVKKGYICLDGHSACVDPATGIMLAALAMPDVIHLNYIGAWSVAQYLKPQLDPLIPKYPRQTSSPNQYVQLLGNPQGNGTTGSIGGLLTGTTPTGWQGGANGAAAAVASQVARSDYKTGKVTRLTFSAGSAANDYIYLEAGRPFITPRLQNTVMTTNARVNPATYTGVQYAVTTGGTTANVADPSAGWTQVIGATVTDGTVTYTVVPSIAIGDTIEYSAEILAANFNSLPGTVRLSLAFYTAAVGLITQYYGSFADASYTIPSQAGSPQVLRTQKLVIPPLCAYIIARVQVIAQSGAVVDIGNVEIVKSN
jgi:hypothetical protein